MGLLKYRVDGVSVGIIVLLFTLTTCQSEVDFTSTQEIIKPFTETPTLYLEPTTITPTTNTPIPTKKPISTITVTPVALEPTPDENPYFSLVDANTAPPEDIIDEVMYFFGAGPGYCDMMWGESENLEIEVCPGEEIEQMGFLRIMVTGMNAGDPVSLTIINPDGDQVEESLTANNGGYLTYDYIPELTDQAGEYIFSFQIPKGNIQKDIRIIQPIAPRLYLIPDENKLILINFTPNEQIRLFYFGSKLDFGLKAWQSFHADNEGSLTIDFPPLEWPLFVAVGDISGQATFQEKGANALVEVWAGGDVICPGAPPPLGLKDGDEVFVTSDIQAKIEEYSMGIIPDISYAQIPASTKLLIQYDWRAPRCENESIWWSVNCPTVDQVNCDGPPYIWIPEGHGDTYYIQPTNP